MSRAIATYLIGALTTVGAYASIRFLWRRWLLGTRGEYHCSECGHVSPLPTDRNPSTTHGAAKP